MRRSSTFSWKPVHQLTALVTKLPPQIKDFLADSQDTTLLRSFAVDGLQPTAHMGPVCAVLVAEPVLQVYHSERLPD
jgi:hypothetical protein